MEFFGQHKEVIEFLFGGVGITLVGGLGLLVRKLRSRVSSLATALREEQAVSPGAALAMVYYDNFLRPVADALAEGEVTPQGGEPIGRDVARTFVLWMPEDMPLDPHLRARYASDLVSNRRDVVPLTLFHPGRGRSFYAYGKWAGDELRVFDQPIPMTTLSYFARVLDAAGSPKEMDEDRRAALHRRERGVFIHTIQRLVKADGLGEGVRVSAEPIAFL
jgi:hypothetical protein